jgi:hypothetical protein
VPATVVQTKSGVTGSAATTLSVVYTSAPTQNNTLVAVAGSDTTLTMSSTGWSLVKSAVDFTGLYLWQKIAGASESSTVTITFASDQAQMAVYELGSMLNPSVDASQTSLPGTTTATVPSGTTATLAQADEWAIAAWNRQGAAAVNSISNSYVQAYNVSGSGGTQTTMTVATLDLSSTAATSSTVVFAATSPNPSGLIATFKAAAAAAAVGPRRMPLGV